MSNTKTPYNTPEQTLDLTEHACYAFGVQKYIPESRQAFGAPSISNQQIASAEHHAQTLFVLAQALFAPGTTGFVALDAAHTRIDAALTQILVQLANQGEQIAVIVADNQWNAADIARGLNNPEQIQVARGETPHQVRYLVQRLNRTGTAYSIAVVVGLLEPFYDEQVKWTLARHLLADTLRLLNELALTLRVLVVVTPAPKPTRLYLREQVARAADMSLELPALEPPTTLPQGRLF